MTTMASRSPPPGEFDFLTDKQVAVLDLLASNRTSKEIAHSLGVSETAVNRRIEVLRSRLGGIDRRELTRRYLLWKHARPAVPIEDAAEGEPTVSGPPCVEDGIQKLQLAQTPGSADTSGRDSEAVQTVFQDPVAMSIEAPWKEWSEPRIVPRVLDGENATLTRGAAIALLLAAIVASIVLGLAAAQALADAVS